MTWTTPANAVADITKIYHVFAIHGVFQSYGYIFGAMGNDPDFHIQEYNGGSLNSPIWHQTEWTTTAVRQGRTYLDGERVDGTMVAPKVGWQLLEVALVATKLPHAANFFNDRNITAYGKRVGGDNLCEVAVFTNRLSETDRLRVQQYLMQKWLAPKPTAALAVSASASGTVVADVSTNSSLTLRLNGDGTVLKQGSGTVVLDDTPAVKTVFRSASVQSGLLDARVPVPLSLSAGNRVTASNTVITVALDAGVGQVVKEGTGTVTLTSLPQDLMRLTVNSGVLILTPPAVSNTVSMQTSGTISNATFEAEQLTSYRRSIVNGETYYGWTAYVPAATGSADNAVFIFNRSADATKWPCDYEAPEGKQVLALKQDASASTPLSLPVAGIYDLSFFTSARSFLTGRHEFDLCIVDGTDTNVAAFVQTVNQPYVRQTFRLPWLEAGNHTLLFRRNVMGLDTLGTIDDIKVTLVSETKPSGLKIFNGDFELTTYPRNLNFTTSNVALGWSFTCTTSGITTASVTMPNSAAPYNFYTPSSPYGAVELGIYSNGSATTSLTLPAGTYQLQADICNWPCQVNGRTVSGTQSIKATVTHGAGATDTLGTIATNASILSTAVWPTAFSVTNNETVSLALTGQSALSGGLVDNLVLILQTNAIVQNGSFEAGANWTFEFNTNAVPKANASYNSLSTSNDYGSAVYDGTRRLCLVQTGAAVQDVQLSAGGLYRLVLHAAQRTPLTYSNTYGHNPVRAWLAQSGVTNVLGWTRVDDSVFVRREFLFPVAAAGTYRLGLQGMTDNSPAFPGTDQNAMIDGVVIERVTNLGDTGFALPKELAIAVANGARLQLSYMGTQTVDTVSYDGHLISGLISQQTCPAFVSGPGALFAPSKGTLIRLR